MIKFLKSGQFGGHLGVIWGGFWASTDWLNPLVINMIIIFVINSTTIIMIVINIIIIAVIVIIINISTLIIHIVIIIIMNNIRHRALEARVGVLECACVVL